VLVDDNVPFRKVGTFIWPKTAPCIVSEDTYRDSGSNSADPTDISHARKSSTNTQRAEPSVVDVDAEQNVGVPKVIGVFMHGGGYTQMSAHEKAGTSRIPRRLVKVCCCILCMIPRHRG
jgi:hypothetical protein